MYRINNKSNNKLTNINSKRSTPKYKIPDSMEKMKTNGGYKIPEVNSNFKSNSGGYDLSSYNTSTLQSNTSTLDSKLNQSLNKSYSNDHSLLAKSIIDEFLEVDDTNADRINVNNTNTGTENKRSASVDSLDSARYKVKGNIDNIQATDKPKYKTNTEFKMKDKSNENSSNLKTKLKELLKSKNYINSEDNYEEDSYEDENYEDDIEEDTNEDLEFLTIQSSMEDIINTINEILQCMKECDML